MIDPMILQTTVVPIENLRYLSTGHFWIQGVALALMQVAFRYYFCTLIDTTIPTRIWTLPNELNKV